MVVRGLLNLCARSELILVNEMSLWIWVLPGDDGILSLLTTGLWWLSKWTKTEHTLHTLSAPVALSQLGLLVG